jgi:hypothetical protein
MGELEMQPTLTEGASGSGEFGEAHPRFSFTWNVSKVEIPTPSIPAELQVLFPEPPRLPEPHLGRVAVTIKWTRAGRSFDATAETLTSGKRLQTLEELNALTQPPAE